MLIVLTFLPEIIILATSILAKMMGCQTGSEVTCTIGPSSAGDIIRNALKAGSFVGFRFSDGLAHFIPYAAAPIMPALATRAGGEAVSIDF